MENNDLNIKIERFLDGQMPPDEASAFKVEIAENETLAEAVSLARIERLMKARMMDSYMESKLAEWQNDDPPPPSPGAIGKTKKSRRAWLLLLIPLLVAGVWYFTRIAPALTTQPKTPTPAQETPTVPTEQTPVPPGTKPEPSQKKTPPADIPIAQNAPTNAQLLALVEENNYVLADYFPHGTRGAADDLAKAEKARKSGNFAEAISIYEKVAKENNNPGLEAAWNLALLYFEQKKYKEAAPYFEKTANAGNFLYDNDARYYLALCKIATRQFSQAEALLHELLGLDYFENADSRAKAEKLKERVGKLK